MQRIVTCAAGMYSQLSEISSEIQIFNYGYPIILMLCIYVSNGVGIRPYFVRQKGVRERKVLEKRL